MTLREKIGEDLFRGVERIVCSGILGEIIGDGGERGEVAEGLLCVVARALMKSGEPNEVVQELRRVSAAFERDITDFRGAYESAAETCVRKDGFVPFGEIRRRMPWAMSDVRFDLMVMVLADNCRIIPIQS